MGEYFFNINIRCCIDPATAGSISYQTNSALFCQKVTKSQAIMKNYISQRQEETREVLGPIKACSISSIT